MGKKLLAADSTDSGQALKRLVFPAVVFGIVTQRYSTVGANQNTAFDKRSVSKQKHKRAKPFG